MLRHWRKAAIEPDHQPGVRSARICALDRMKLHLSQAERFLAKNMFTGLKCPNDLTSMKVVPRGDNNRINGVIKNDLLFVSCGKCESEFFCRGLRPNPA